MERFSLPYSLKQEFIALGEDCLYQACCCLLPFPFGHTFSFWGTSNSVEDPQLRLIFWAFIPAKFSQVCSEYAPDSQSLRDNFSGASLPGNCLSQEQESFPRSPIYFLSSSSQIMLKPRRSEERQRHERSPFPPYSFSYLLLATSETEKTD